MSRGRLTIVGTGIQCGPQTTAEALHALETADRVFFLVANPVADHWIRRLNPSAESLANCYRPGESRRRAYRAMESRVLRAARNGGHICVAFYGHPGVFVRPSHGIVRRASEEGIPARLCPGVSAEDCLFADLDVDPAAHGCQSFEATDFLVHHRRFDPRCALILWQIGVIGHQIVPPGAHSLGGLQILAEELARWYPASHEVVIYEASELPMGGPRVDRIPLTDLRGAEATMKSTLYVSPRSDDGPDSDMVERLQAAIE
ncbi:MAG: SAM-dependent methyltransferase [Acidobacteriota bacterium]